MRNSRLLFGTLIAAGTFLTVSNAYAVPCKGYGAGKSAKAVMVHKAKDGSQILLVGSTRIQAFETPDNYPADKSWQNCSGLWTLAADKKSGSGSGHCYAVDADGDQHVVRWEGTHEGGTWADVSGTGKYADSNAGKGTWSPSRSYGDGLKVFPFEGECDN